METVKTQTKKKHPKAPLVVSVKTASGNVASMRQISASEVKALRNSAYSYLA